MTRVFCDANVLFSAAIIEDGRSSALFAGSDAGRHSLLASAHVIEEVRRNLAARYPASAGGFELVLLPQVKVVGEAAPALVDWAATQGLPSSDAPVLAAAVQAQADALATGDRTHFGHLFGKSRRGVKVLGLAQALEFVESAETKRGKS